MTVARYDLNYFFFNAGHFLGCAVSHLEEGCDLLPILLALAALAKGIVAHGPHLPIFIQHHNMIITGSDHRKRGHVLHENRSFNDEVPSELWP